MLRDRLVVGIRDLSLSEKLQTDPMLTLEKAKTLIRQKVAVKDHCHELQLYQMGSEADLEATSLFRMNLIIELNNPFWATVHKMWS